MNIGIQPFFVFRYLTILVMVLAQKVAHAQELKNFKTVSQFNADYFMPGISGEIAVGPKSTIAISNNLDFFVKSSKSSAFYGFAGFGNNTILEFRRYYSLNYHMNRNAKLHGNSGEYIALYSQYDYNFRYKKALSIPVALVWGIQRTFRNRFYYNVNGGVGYSPHKRFYNIPLYPAVHASMGYVISKPRRVN